MSNEKFQYEVGGCYPFWVKSVFGNYCEVKDEHTTTYLQNTKNLILQKGQRIDCKIISTKKKHPKIELLNIAEFSKRASRIDDKVLTRLLAEREVTWTSREFIRLLMMEENDLTFDVQCHSWIQTQIALKTDIGVLRNDCADILEMSNILDIADYSERELIQQRLTTIVEFADYYIRAISLLEDEDANAAQDFIDTILLKLKTSGYLFHPRRFLTIMSCLFTLKPELMTRNMDNLFCVIKDRDLPQWKREPFRSAMMRMLETYVNGNEKLITKTKDNAKLITDTIQALSIQLLLHDQNNGDNDIVDYRLNAARLCSFTSYVNMPNSMEIVNLSLHNLLNSEFLIPPYNLATVGTGRFPFFVANSASQLKSNIDTVSTFIRNNVRLTVSANGIELAAVASNTKAVLPKNLNLWRNMQVMLTSKTGSLPVTGKNAITRYQNLWIDIERELFESKGSGSTSGRSHKTHKVGEEIHITINRQDKDNSEKFYCNIVEDETGGEGFIYIHDIVPYNVRAASVRHFLSEMGHKLVFTATIIDKDDDMFHFSMMEYLRDWTSQFYDDDEDIICFVGSNQSRSAGWLPGISNEGLSVSLKGLENITGLKKGNVISAKYIGRSPFNDFHIEAQVTNIIDYDFNMAESFHFLMKEAAYAEITPTGTTIADGDFESDRILGVDYVKELILLIDRVSVLDSNSSNDNEYIKAYNYLGFARMLSLLIGNEDRAAYYKGRMDIILLLHDFAVNDRVDESALSQLETVNTDLFTTNAVLHNKFRQLQLVSFLDKPENNPTLWEASNDNDETIKELASLVLSYNFMKAANLQSQATDVHNRIKQALRFKGYESGLMMYGTGTEDKTTEYKTSIIYVADKDKKDPDMQEQMKVILAVINSFLNTDGGTLYIGVNDSGMGVGVDDELNHHEFNGDRDKYARTITNSVIAAFGARVATHVDVRFDAANQKKAVCIVSVTPYLEGIHLNGSWYVRIGSTKKKMSREEFLKYNAADRAAIPAAAASMATPSMPPAMPDNGQTAVKEEAGEEKEEAKTPAAATKPQPFVPSPAGDAPEEEDGIKTSAARFNVIEEYDENYRPTIAYLQFMDNAKFCKMTEYNWDPQLLTLAVYDEESDGVLVLGYEDGNVAKIPLNEILKFDDNKRYTRYGDSPLLFASIAHDDDALVTVTEEDKGTNGRPMVRIDILGNMENTKLAGHGDRFFNDGIARRIIKYEIIPAHATPTFKLMMNMDRRTLGSPVRTLSPDIAEGFAKLGIEL